MDDLIRRQDAIDAYCMKECGMERFQCDCEDCGNIFANVQSAEAFELGKPHRLCGFELLLTKDAFGGDWVEIRRTD